MQQCQGRGEGYNREGVVGHVGGTRVIERTRKDKIAPEEAEGRRHAALLVRHPGVRAAAASEIEASVCTLQ